MTTGAERLYNLLPAHHRIKDAEQGGPLRALLAIIETELEAVESDIDGLYDDAFIETCSDDLVPYIGDLLGVRLPYALDGATVSRRAYVANTLAYRRRKGTAAVLEQLAADVLGWPARVVEYFRLVTATQHLQHVRLDRWGTPDLRDGDAMELLGSPFSTVTRSVDVRRIESRRGKYNLPNVGLFVWRLGASPIAGVTAGTRRGLPVGYFTFDPSGRDAPLFHRPEEEIALEHIAEEWNVPGPLRRRALYDEIEARKKDASATAHWLGASPVFTISVTRRDGTSKTYDWTEIDIDHLGDPSSGNHRRPAPGRVAVDPELGRIALPEHEPVDKVVVGYAYGAPGEVGAGSYDRQDVVRDLPANPGFRASVKADAWALQKAIEAWNAWAQALPAGGDPADPSRTGIIAIGDNATREIHSSTELIVPAGTRLILVAALQTGTGETATLDAQGLRPFIRGSLRIRGVAAADATPGEVVLDGLWLDGGVVVAAGNLGSLQIGHATIAPGATGLRVSKHGDDQNASLAITMRRTISGAVALAPTVPSLTIEDSLVDGALEATGTDATITASTLLGRALVRTLEADNAIFLRHVEAERKQEGCVRYSYVPRGSTTPRRFACQPDLALAGARGPREAQRIVAALTPRFTSTTWGDPGYGQLAAACPDEIERGADDGAEMGCFHHLMAPQREANLRAALDEYLRFGLLAGIFYVT